LNDFTTTLLNLSYFAVILLYVYPLKILFSLLTSSWTGLNLFLKASEKGLAVLGNDEFPLLIMLFSTGYFVIWLLFYYIINGHCNFPPNWSLTSMKYYSPSKKKEGTFGLH